MRQRGRGGIKEFETGILQRNWHLGGTLALPLSQTTRSSFCQCRRLSPPTPQKVVAAMQLEPPK